MNILLFGPPGAGKGTQSANLISKFSMIQVSTGDLFRSAMKLQSSLGIKAKSFIDSGNLVPDSIVTSMVEEELQKIFLKSNDSNIILDGFPRTVQQAVDLDIIFKKLNKEIDSAIFINLDADLIVKRLVGRRICKSCSAVYHVDTFPSKIAGKCDKCSGELYQRSDDNESVIKARLDVYFKSANELSEYYKSKNLYQEVDGLGTSEEVFTRLSKFIKP